MQRNSWLSRFAAASLVVASLVFAGSARAAEVNPAPTVALHNESGEVVQTTAYKGSVVVVDFWASWCPPCKTSFPALDALFQRYRSRGVQVLAINVDEKRKDADTFLAAHLHVMPVLFDPNGDAPAAFMIRGMPSSVILDRRGDIRFRHEGYSAKVLDTYAREIDALLAER